MALSMTEIAAIGRRAGAIRDIYRSGPKGDAWMYAIVYRNGSLEHVAGLDELSERVHDIIVEYREWKKRNSA